jgi:hypothetical protein
MKSLVNSVGIILLIVTAIIAVLPPTREIKPPPQPYLNKIEIIRSITGYTCETYLGTEYPCSYEESKTRGYGSAWAEYR